MTTKIKGRLDNTVGNTPLSHFPDDYIPEESGRWLVLWQGPDAGKKIFFYDFVLEKEGVAENQTIPTVVFVHGNPESSYTYAQTRDELIKHATQTMRVVAMDHIGFGLSDQASFEMVDMHHAANLTQLIEFLDLKNVTLVVHDWGGAIGIGAFIDQAERVVNLVLMNTTVFPIPLQGLNYTTFPFKYLGWNSFGYRTPWQLWKHVAPLVMYSGVGQLNFFKRIGDYFLRAILGRLTEGERMYRDMFSTRMNALSSKRNVKQTKVWGHGYYYHDANLGLQDNRSFYKNIQKEISPSWGKEGQNIGVRAFFGEWDPTARSDVQNQWLEALPQLQGHISTFPDAGHFVEEHKFEEIAQGILDVLKIA